MRLPAILFSLFLLAVVISLLVLHVRAWRKARQAKLEPVERRFAHRQFLRRMQASAMLGLVAVSIPAGSFIPHLRWPTVFVFFWSAVAMLVIWVLLLAMIDILATGRHTLEASRRNLTEEAKLRAELRRHLLARGNGHPHSRRRQD